MHDGSRMASSGLVNTLSAHRAALMPRWHAIFLIQHLQLTILASAKSMTHQTLVSHSFTMLDFPLTTA